MASATDRIRRFLSHLTPLQGGLEGADVDYLRTMMEYAVIRAPFDGHVTHRWVDPGAFVQSAEKISAARPLLTMTRTNMVRINLDLPMAQVRLLDRGDRVLLDRISVLPGERFEGHVSRFSAALDRSSRMQRVEIDLPNDDGRLRAGYYGYVTVFLKELADTPVIPSSAMMSDGREKFVYVVEEGKAQRRAITTSYEDGERVEIASGLSGGEEILRAGLGQIDDGQRIVAVPADRPVSR